jgi:uncharacterized membrane protein
MRYRLAAAGALSALVVAVLVTYPLLVYFGIGRFGPSAMAAVLLVVCLLRLLVVKARGNGTAVAKQTALIAGGGALLACAGLVLGRADALLYYPVLVNATLCVLFALSLVYPPSAIERIARLREPDLPPEGVRYTRRVTVAWIAFFVGNGTIALYTAMLAPLATWALYNGLIAYVLIGAMFAVEFAIRSVVMRRRP